VTLTSESIYFNLHPVNFLIISGILQGYFIATILFFRNTDRSLSNKLLSFTIIAVNLHLTYLMLLDLNLDNIYPHLLSVPYSHLTAIGPLLLLYTRSLLENQFILTKREALLFAPLTIEWLLQLLQIGYSMSHNIAYYNTPFDPTVSIVIYVCSAISVFYYLKRSLTIIDSHELWVKRNFSNLAKVTLSWLQKLLLYYRVLWLLWIPFAAVFLIFFRLQIQYFALILLIYLLMLAITYLTYWIGIEGVRKMDLPVLNSKSDPSIDNKTYSNIDEHQIVNHINSIRELMTVDRLYLNENLSLRDLADRLAIDPNQLSYILNTHLHKNFYEFINWYRVEEVKYKLSQPTHKHLTILGIALESGFNSKTSFNRVFKQLTGLTPSQYQKQSDGK